MKLRLILLSLGYLLAVPAFSASSLETELLRLHNDLRAQHQAPNLTWDPELAQYARKHAQHCVFKHSHSPYGENLAAGYPSLEAAINTWYAEGEAYSYQRPAYHPSTGHFTQLIWFSTKKLGCAYVACDGKNGTPGKYLVCEYSPPGNVVNKGYFKANVLPLS